jgi:hypothetical protein
MAKITTIRGDTRTVTATFLDSDGAAIDLTGGTIFFTVNASNSPTDDTSAAIEVDVTSFDAPTTGVQDITLTAANTNITPGTYYYDIQFVSASGVVTSLPQNKFIVKADISRRTS